MSMDKPNEYEQSIEDYASAALRMKRAHRALEDAKEDLRLATIARDEKWTGMRKFITDGKIERGIYRLKVGDGPHAYGILITGDAFYYDVVPMFR